MLKSAPNVIRSTQDSRKQLRLAAVLISLTRNTESKANKIQKYRAEVLTSQLFFIPFGSGCPDRECGGNDRVLL